MRQVWSAKLPSVGRWVVLVALVGLGGVACSSSAEEPLPPEQIFFDVDVELVQLDYTEFAGFEADDTPFGGAFVEFDAPPGLYFANLWLELESTTPRSIVNFPVVTCGGPRRVFFAIDLRPLQEELGRDEITEIRCAPALSTLPVEVLDSGFQTALVESYSIRFASGIQDAPLEPPGLPAWPKLPQARADPESARAIDYGYDANYACHASFPNQECGLAECGPAAVSNSLKFLGAGEGHNEIADCMPFMDFSATGSDFNWAYTKRDATDQPPYDITTTILKGAAAGPVRDFPEVIEAIRAGKDVEVNSFSHVAAVVAAAEVFVPGGPLYVLYVAHDVRQGAPGGTIVEAVYYDSDRRVWAGGTSGFFDNRQHMSFVIEWKP